MIEPRPGLYLGNPSARIRDSLWARAAAKIKDGAVIQIWSDVRTPQGYVCRTAGRPSKSMVDMEGITLVLNPAKQDRRATGQDDEQIDSPHVGA
jgi:CRISPR-associated protein Cas2